MRDRELVMPRQNRFRHQAYVAADSPPIPTTVTAVRPEQITAVDVGETLRELRVRFVFLVHGTFVGDDPFGVAQKLDDLSESVPPMLRPALNAIALDSWGRIVRGINQRFGDKVLGETCSFRDDYVEDFRTLLKSKESQVTRFDWSSGNDHVARSAAAISLFLKLSDLPIDPERDRVMLWGHSHAGNVFAILTNLLANDRAAVAKFFESAGVLAKDNIEWNQAQARLAAAPSPHPLAKSLCLVTFGTPVRYGWDCDGFGQLLHIVNHRSHEGLRPFQAKPALPQAIDEILSAKHGDWVQSFGVVGTDLTPLDRERRELQQSLGEFLETGVTQPEVAGPQTLLDHLPETTRERVQSRLNDVLRLQQRWRCGSRVPADGNAAWLFDYGEHETEKFGHGVYTKRTWLPFHASRIADWLRIAVES